MTEGEINTLINIHNTNASKMDPYLPDRWRYDNAIQQTEQPIITNTIKCSKCGGTGHVESDCMFSG